MIESVRLQQFRSYLDTSFEFEHGVNIVVGPNASGKTNLLEAILMICRGKSYRVQDADLIAHNKDWARIDAQLQESSRSLKIEIKEERIEKSFIINDTVYKRLPHPQTIPVVLFEPNDLLLLTQSPDLRRGYIDDVLEQLQPGFGQLRRDYKRTLAQRNRLLKTGGLPDQFFVWNVRLSELGGKIAEQRHAFIQEHTGALNDLYNALVETTHTIDFLYQTKLPINNYTTAMLHDLEKNTQKDSERGFTSVGPHRDDLAISIDGHHIALAASRGETRTIMLALKLLELTSLEKARGVKPILLLDDVFSELDGARRKKLTEYLKNHQSFITTTDADIVVQHFLGECNVIAMG